MKRAYLTRVFEVNYEGGDSDIEATGREACEYGSFTELVANFKDLPTNAKKTHNCIRDSLLRLMTN